MKNTYNILYYPSINAYFQTFDTEGLSNGEVAMGVKNQG